MLRIRDVCHGFRLRILNFPSWILIFFHPGSNNNEMRRWKKWLSSLSQNLNSIIFWTGTEKDMSLVTFFKIILTQQFSPGPQTSMGWIRNPGKKLNPRVQESKSATRIRTKVWGPVKSNLKEGRKKQCWAGLKSQNFLWFCAVGWAEPGGHVQRGRSPAHLETLTWTPAPGLVSERHTRDLPWNARTWIPLCLWL